MSTRSVIGVYDETTDKVTYVYCHFDGYPEHMVPSLRRYIDKESVLNEIISLGGFRSIDEKNGPEDVYGTKKAGELSLYDYIHKEDICWSDYRYLFMNDKWMCFRFNPANYDEDDEYITKLREKLKTMLSFIPNEHGGYDFL